MLDIHKGYLETLGRYQNKPLEKGYLDPNDEIPGKDTVLYYLGTPQDTTGTIYDWSGQENDGTIIGATLNILPSGLPLLDYDGLDDKVDQASDVASLKITGALTLMAWIKPDVVNEFTGIITKCNDTLRRAYFLAMHSDGSAYVYQSGDGGAVNRSFRKTATTILTTECQFLVGVYVPSTSLDIYLNGALDNGTLTGTIQAATNNTADPVVIGWGHSSVTTEEYFNGSIARPRICKGALTANQIEDFYRQERHLFGV